MLWSQVIQSVLRQDRGDQIIPDIAIEGRTLTLSADAVDEDGRFMNDLESVCELYYLGKDGRVFSSSSRTTLGLPMVAPGRFSATTSVDKDGVYLVRLVAAKPSSEGSKGSTAQGLKGSSAPPVPLAEPLVRTIGVVVSSSLEFSRLDANLELAGAVASATYGKVGAEPESVFRDSDRTLRQKDYGVWLLILAAVMFLADCLARRWPAVRLLLESRR